MSANSIDHVMLDRLPMKYTALSALLLTAAWAQENPVAFTGARVIPISGPEIPDGTVVIQNGRILAVGPSASVRVPASAQKLDVKGKVVMPGLVDSHSHIGSGMPRMFQRLGTSARRPPSTTSAIANVSAPKRSHKRYASRPRPAN